MPRGAGNQKCGTCMWFREKYCTAPIPEALGAMAHGVAAPETRDDLGEECPAWLPNELPPDVYSGLRSVSLVRAVIADVIRRSYGAKRSAPKVQRSPVKRVEWKRWAELWNKVALKCKLPALDGDDPWTPSLKRKLQKRLAEDGAEKVERVLTAPLRSPFLRGENDQGWYCDIDWLLGPRNFAKVLSGKYERSPKRRGVAASGTDDQYSGNVGF